MYVFAKRTIFQTYNFQIKQFTIGAREETLDTKSKSSIVREENFQLYCLQGVKVKETNNVSQCVVLSRWFLQQDILPVEIKDLFCLRTRLPSHMIAYFESKLYRHVWTTLKSTCNTLKRPPEKVLRAYVSGDYPCPLNWAITLIKLP
ncbi:hypothetical protein TNCV_2306161 [Trichonephila clavipes]|nr:hypothetical protein TNCV_2306161 [Trichonephila clavipes]